MIAVTDLMTLDQTAVADTQASLTQMLQVAYPTVDLKRGVVHDLLLQLAAVLTTARREEMARLRRSMSLAAIEADPDLADDATVDAVLSNYGVTRQQGAQAVGEVLVVLSSQTPVTIAAGSVWEASGQQFTATSTFSAKLTQAAVLAPTDRLLQQLGPTAWGFLIAVKAIDTGAAGQLTKGTRLIPAQPPRQFVRAEAASNFTGGVTTESTSDLVGRLRAGAASKCTSNRVTTDALIRREFPTIVATSCVGFGDPEMDRDRHSIFPISMGGRCDLYVRTQETLQEVTIEVPAQLVERRAEGGVWQATIDRTALPGYYRVRRITRSTDEFQVLMDTRQFAVGSDTWYPDIQHSREAVYSSYQTGIVTWLDSRTDTDAVVGSATQTYRLTLEGQPLIADLQALFADRDHRPIAGDILVKAAVPMYLSVACTINLRPTDTAPDESLVRQSLVTQVNRLGFPGRVETGPLVHAVQSHLDGQAAVGSLVLSGRIYAAADWEAPVSSTAGLVVPLVPTRYLGPRTVSPFLSPTDITFSYQRVN